MIITKQSYSFNWTPCTHMLYIQKQFNAATASMFFFALKSPARTLRVQSILAIALLLPGSIARETVVFLKLSSYWVLLPSASMRWKELLQFPVKMVLLSIDEEMLNLSKMQSFSNIQQSLPFIPYCRTIVFTGFFALQTSQILTVRKSRLMRYLEFLVNSAEEQQEIISVRKFFCPLDSALKLRAVLSVRAETLISQSFKVPLFVPQVKRLSQVGCILLKVMFSLMSSILSFLRRSATRKGLSGFQQLHRKVWTSSLESRYYSLKEELIELIEERCLGENCFWSVEMYPDSMVCILGMPSSLPADLIIFFSVFSQIFQSLMFLSLVVTIFMQLPWGESQLMSLISYSISMLLRGSNSLV